ncbi:CTP synthase [candidate division WWE3 bacterium]|nr:CTP synthase [candidate division WWE3 bacterium]
MAKYIFVTGGVLSGLGKGITAASLALLLKSRGYTITAAKCDMYLNVDAGTMNPLEHGEVFVTQDGLETDQDLGHYERFLSTMLTRDNYMTNGQIYWEVLQKERALEYGGKCVQPYHHIPPVIINHLNKAIHEHHADIILVELGGTVGEYEGLLFLETIRRLKRQYPGDVALVHVGYLPAPASIGELKSKPLQQSVTQLNAVGLEPDFIIARAAKPIDHIRKEKIALAAGLPVEHIISNPDVKSIYEVPLILKEQHFDEIVLDRLNLKHKKSDLKDWEHLVRRIKADKPEIKIAMVGKYQTTGDYTLEDAYVCVVEALKHAGWAQGVSPKLTWIDAEKLQESTPSQVDEILKDFDGMIVPQGWGSRGVEGKIKAIEYAREHKLPYLGLCFGMQMAVIEFARHVVGLTGANSTEVNDKTKYPVIHVMPHQKEYLENKQYGGTIRMGQWPCVLKEGTHLHAAYQEMSKDIPYVERKRPLTVLERHRHRYEFNNEFKKQLEQAGLIISGTSPDGKLVESVELPTDVHPFFVATQFHPEYQSWPLIPNPVFMAFIEHVRTNSK